MHGHREQPVPVCDAVGEWMTEQDKNIPELDQRCREDLLAFNLEIKEQVSVMSASSNDRMEDDLGMRDEVAAMGIE